MLHAPVVHAAMESMAAGDTAGMGISTFLFKLICSHDVVGAESVCTNQLCLDGELAW